MATSQDAREIVKAINIASRLMGHSNISITSKIYTHASTEALEKARDLTNGKKEEKETSQSQC